MHHEALRSASFRRRSDRGDRCGLARGARRRLYAEQVVCVWPNGARPIVRHEAAERSARPRLVSAAAACASFTRGAGAFPIATSSAHHVASVGARPQRRFALAASIVLAVAWWRSSTSTVDAPHGQSYATTSDGFERVSLDDGSLVELQLGHEFQVRFSSSERQVRLVSGRGLLTVAKDAARPFSVEAGLVAVRAVGPRSTCASGARHRGAGDRGQGRARRHRNFSRAGGVALRRASSRFSRNLPPSRPRFSPRTSAWCCPRCDPRSQLAPVKPPLVEKLAPERRPRSARLAGTAARVRGHAAGRRVSRSFNRRNHVQITLADPELGQLPIGGSFRAAENVDAFVRLLASGNDIAIERPDTARIVLRKAK